MSETPRTDAVCREFVEAIQAAPLTVCGIAVILESRLNKMKAFAECLECELAEAKRSFAKGKQEQALAELSAFDQGRGAYDQVAAYAEQYRAAVVQLHDAIDKFQEALRENPKQPWSPEWYDLIAAYEDTIDVAESAALAKNPATAIPGAQPAECARYMPGTSGEPDGGPPVAPLTERLRAALMGIAKYHRDNESGWAERPPNEWALTCGDMSVYHRSYAETAEAALVGRSTDAPRVEDNTGMEAALLEDVGRLRQKIHVMGKALKHQRTALMIVRDRQSGTARVEDINQGIAQIDAALSYVPPENGTPEEDSHGN